MVNLYRRVLVNQYEEPEEAAKEETQMLLWSRMIR